MSSTALHQQENVVRTSSESPHCQAEKRRMLEVLGAKSPPGGLPGQTPPAPAAARDSVSPPLARSSLRQKREKTESQAPFQAVARARCPQWELVPLNPNDPPGQLLGQERVPWVDWQGCMEALGSGVRQFNPRTHVRHTGPGSHCGGQGVPRCPGESAGCLPGGGDLLSRQAQSARACAPASPSGPRRVPHSPWTVPPLTLASRSQHTQSPTETQR